MVRAVKVPLSEAEKTRKTLAARGVLDADHYPKREDGYLLIPVTEDVEGYETVGAELEERERGPPTLREALEGKLDEQELEDLKTAYDLVGDIAILEIDEELRHREKLIGETLLSLHPNIKTVVRKAGAHTGELRLQSYEHLAGEKKTETVVRENGVDLEIDIERTYYSVRSATERARIASLVGPGERVLVMFSGIAPFPLVIAEHSSAERVVGVELNEAAHRLAERNVARNKHEGRVEVLQGDVCDVVPELGAFDRVVMPLPHTAEDFLDVAVLAVKEEGWIHLYHFSSEEEVEALAKELPERLEGLSMRGEVRNVQQCGSLAPDVYRWCLDIRATKK